MWLYSRSKNFAADNHPPRRRSGGAGTAWQQRWTHLSPPAGGKGIPKGRVPLALPRAGAARRVGEKRKTFSLASIISLRILAKTASLLFRGWLLLVRPASARSNG